MMKSLMTLIFIACCFQSLSQTQSYVSDVDAFYRVLKNTSSFKEQITGKHIMGYDSLYQADVER